MPPPDTTRRDKLLDDYWPMLVASLLSQEGQWNPVGMGPAGRMMYQNPWGSVSSELSATVTEPFLNQGRPTNIPTIFAGRQWPAIFAADIISRNKGFDPESGRRMPSFDTIEEAVAAASGRSKQLGQRR